MDASDKKCSILESDYQIRFIRDLINEEYFELVNGALIPVGIDQRKMNEMIAKIPLKLWIKFRIYNFWARNANPNTERGKRIIEKYNDVFEKFLNT